MMDGFREALLPRRLPRSHHDGYTLVIAGDFNADLKVGRSRPLSSVFEQELRLRQWVDFTTRHDRRGRQSTLDHVWCNVKVLTSVCEELHGASDHEAVWVGLPAFTPAPHERSRRRVVRSWKGADPAAVAATVSAGFRGAAGCGPQVMADWWHASWRMAAGRHAPARVVQRCRRPRIARPPWLTEEVRALVKEKHKLRVEACRRRSRGEAVDVVQLAGLRAAVKEAVRGAQRSYVSRRREELGRKRHISAGDGWGLVRELTKGVRVEPFQPPPHPDRINAVLLGKAQKVRMALRGVPPPEVPDTGVPEFSMGAVSDFEVWAVISRARKSAAVGHDNASMKLLASCAEHFLPELTELCSTVLRGDVWPRQWKRSEVLPLWKRKGSHTDPASYRPVSILPAVSRVVEAVLESRLRKHAEVVGALPECQHGFRRHRGTETAIAHLVDEMARRRGDGPFVCVVSQDIRAAFDCVDHDILLLKLERRLGVVGAPLRLLRSYLSGRKQRVRKLDGSRGSWSAVEAGVPQGSVLGPLLFLLYTADVTVDGLCTVQYADDSTAVVSAGTADAARAAASEALSLLKSVYARNQLMAAPEKFQAMLVGPGSADDRRESGPLHVGGVEVPLSDTINVLGVRLDSKLSWLDQARKAAAKATAAAASLRRTLAHLPCRDRVFLAETLALPYVDYCQTALELPTGQAATVLRRAYQRVARYATREGRSMPALEVAGWPAWAHRRRAVRAAFACAVWELGRPSVLRRLLPETGGCTRRALGGRFSEVVPD
eukprot:TRINITY_DN13411_c0_g1_i5.p1 TRINITY_DN13411_c0_g1~~TRINITY_DN13411_c0_g1_i5.p1  ORF type:complete len:775 (+),score=141.42 TRINITY_DN13411_c0_g1_i5:2874-5198(+)